MSAFSFLVAIAASQPCPVGKTALASLIVRRNSPRLFLHFSNSCLVLGANAISLHVAKAVLVKVSSSDPACKAIVSAWCKALFGAACWLKVVLCPAPERGVACLSKPPCVGAATGAEPVRSCKLGWSSSFLRIEGRESWCSCV